jgi:hypothetical protein
MVQEVLREIGDAEWLNRIDLETGERVGASFVSPKHESRESDFVWRFRRKDGGEPVHVLILQAQTEPDPSLPVRLMAYESLLYQDLIIGSSEPGRRALPLVSVVAFDTDEMALPRELGLPKFLYWLVDTVPSPREELATLRSPQAALLRVKESQNWWEVRWSVHSLRLYFSRFEASVQRDFETWLRGAVLPRLGLSPDDFSVHVTLEEIAGRIASDSDCQASDPGLRGSSSLLPRVFTIRY